LMLKQKGTRTLRGLQLIDVETKGNTNTERFTAD